jgi:hypothetical protein
MNAKITSKLRTDRKKIWAVGQVGNLASRKTVLLSRYKTEVSSGKKKML